MSFYMIPKQTRWVYETTARSHCWNSAVSVHQVTQRFVCCNVVFTLFSEPQPKLFKYYSLFYSSHAQRVVIDVSYINAERAASASNTTTVSGDAGCGCAAAAQ
jgi:hypothetical protein